MVNVAELLKDCPIGMELDCPVWIGKKTFNGFRKWDKDFPIEIKVDGGEYFLTRYGQLFNVPSCGCVIFPKGKTTWEGFVPPCKFKDGDILAEGSCIFIIQKIGDNCTAAKTHCTLYDDGDFDDGTILYFDTNSTKLATEEEKQKLFQAIKERGYKWNAETKTLEKLVELKFKDGDVISDSLGICIFKGEGCIKGSVDYYCGIHGEHFHVKDDKLKSDEAYFGGNIFIYRLATEEEKQKLFQAIKENGYRWNSETKTLDKLDEPKFKDGDVLSYQLGGFKNRTIYIYRYHKTFNTSYYVALSGDDDLELMVNNVEGGALDGYNDTARLATEEEKQKLFDAIKENGYRWNKETKTLEKMAEPKFHVGDWVVFNNQPEKGSIYQVKDAHNYEYTLQHILGGSMPMPFSRADMLRLWTFQDAKDGDVLADKDNNIGIFQESEDIFWHSYIYLGCDGQFRGFSIGGSHEQTDTHPATKEQRDLLFKKMKETGYIWNEETKTLEKFVEPKFKDGDIITCTNCVCSFISIFKEMASAFSFKHHCSLILGTNTFIHYVKPADYTNPRFATEEEKQKLFDAIKENGYKWYPVTKTLERLFEPKFKVGDKIKPKGSDRYHIIKNIEFDRYILDNNQFIKFNDEHDFELASDKPIWPKFKVWYKIKHIKNGNIYEIIKIIPNYYIAKYIGSDIMISWANQDEYELVPGKFDISILKPFESRVLVRNDNNRTWRPAVFGCYIKNHYESFYVLGGNSWRYCVPYEGNEHLLGKTDECDEYYKIW